MPTVTCPDCGDQLAVVAADARIKHNADGTHQYLPPTPPRAVTDPKPRGRRRG